MQKRVDALEYRVEVLYNQDFEGLVKEAQALQDADLKTEAEAEQVEILMAYLQQFEDQRVVILENAEYSRKQLSDLQDDIKNHVYDEATTAKYIKDEETELRRLEAQLDYFQEKFDAQKKVVKQLRKE